MNSDLEKAIELYKLKAKKFGDISALNQEKYYSEVAQWLLASGFDTLEEATVKMKETPYYEGAAIAKNLDDVDFRIKAMSEVGYNDVADIHRMRKQKLLQRGNGYAFSEEWQEDFKLAQDKVIMYARRKEAFGKVFEGYFQIKGNPQKEHRKNAVNSINQGLAELKDLGTSFYELANDEVYQNLTMTTEKGFYNFVEFVRNFIDNGGQFEDSIDDINAEQQEIAMWVNSNRQQLMKVGEEETWKNAACIAVPSEDPMGYDYIALKEV